MIYILHLMIYILLLIIYITHILHIHILNITGKKKEIKGKK